MHMYEIAYRHRRSEYVCTHQPSRLEAGGTMNYTRAKARGFCEKKQGRFGLRFAPGSLHPQF